MEHTAVLVMRLWRCAFSIKFLYPNSHLTFLANSSMPFSLFKNIQFIDRIFNVQKDSSAFLEEFDVLLFLNMIWKIESKLLENLRQQKY